jgi:predicted dehydrogenase
MLESSLPDSMVTIIGSGFGLYGYLPALVEGLGEVVVLPRTLEEKIKTRPELSSALSGIRWVRDVDAAIAAAETIVIATPPKHQPDIVERCLKFPNIKKFVLEKPLAPIPERAIALLAQLDEAGKGYVIGYSFMHLKWQKKLLWTKVEESAMQIDWSFMANHFSNDLHNWKRRHSEGGGVLRFFGIHMLAMLASLGYNEVRESQLEGIAPDEPERWSATFAGQGLPKCQVRINSRSLDNTFQILSGEKIPMVSLEGPFSLEASTGDADPRVSVLAKILKSPPTTNLSLTDVYRKTNDLWLQTELCSL